jgi:hypothetical protein
MTERRGRTFTVTLEYDDDTNAASLLEHPQASAIGAKEQRDFVVVEIPQGVGVSGSVDYDFMGGGSDHWWKVALVGNDRCATGFEDGKALRHDAHRPRPCSDRGRRGDEVMMICRLAGAAIR